jgi:hypothetical protein
MWHRALLLALPFLVAGCGMKEYADASVLPENARLIGKEFRTPTDAVIHGVTLDRNYKKVVDIYVITDKPGFDGPEVVSRSVLPTALR